MGDRTTAWFTFMKKDEAKVVEIFGYRERDQSFYDCFEDVSEELPGVYYCYAYEMNYGGSSEASQLAQAGVAFYGGWNAGGDYGPGSHACNGDGKLHEINTTHDGDFYVIVMDNGQFYDHELDEVRDFIVLLDQVKTIHAEFSDRYLEVIRDAELFGLTNTGGSDALQGDQKGVKENDQA